MQGPLPLRVVANLYSAALSKSTRPRPLSVEGEGVGKLPQD